MQDGGGHEQMFASNPDEIESRYRADVARCDTPCAPCVRRMRVARRHPGRRLAGGEVVAVTEHDRITPAHYHVAALDILAQRGPGGLRAATLCAALGVPITRVDEEFGSWSGFVEALLEHWESEQTWAPVELALATADPWQRIEVLKHLATTVPHEAEAAIRAWSHSDPVVRRIQLRVDSQRTEALRQVIAGLGVEDAVARRLATMGIALLAGMQQLHAPLDVDRLRAVLTDYEQLVVSHVG